MNSTSKQFSGVNARSLFRFLVFFPISVALACTAGNKLAQEEHLFPYENAVKYPWSGGAAGLTGVTFEIDVLDSNIVLQRLWTLDTTLPFRKVRSKNSVVTWRANFREVEGAPNRQKGSEALPIEFAGEAVISYMIGLKILYQGITSFEKKPQ